MTPKRIIAVLSLAGLLALLAACQTTQTQPGNRRFQKIDTNKDGKLSRLEVDDYFVTDIFESRDSNHDGKLTWQEWNVQGAGLNKARFYGQDRDKDGAVSLDEARAYGRKSKLLNQAFNEADTDRDGYLTQAEARAYYGSKEGAPE